MPSTAATESLSPSKPPILSYADHAKKAHNLSQSFKGAVSNTVVSHRPQQQTLPSHASASSTHIVPTASASGSSAQPDTSSSSPISLDTTPGSSVISTRPQTRPTSPSPSLVPSPSIVSDIHEESVSSNAPPSGAVSTSVLTASSEQTASTPVSALVPPSPTPPKPIVNVWSLRAEQAKTRSKQPPFSQKLPIDSSSSRMAVSRSFTSKSPPSNTPSSLKPDTVSNPVPTVQPNDSSMKPHANPRPRRPSIPLQSSMHTPDIAPRHRLSNAAPPAALLNNTATNLADDPFVVSTARRPPPVPIPPAPSVPTLSSSSGPGKSIRLPETIAIGQTLAPSTDDGESWPEAGKAVGDDGGRGGRDIEAEGSAVESTSGSKTGRNPTLVEALQGVDATGPRNLNRKARGSVDVSRGDARMHSNSNPQSGAPSASHSLTGSGQSSPRLGGVRGRRLPLDDLAFQVQIPSPSQSGSGRSSQAESFALPLGPILRPDANGFYQSIPRMAYQPPQAHSPSQSRSHLHPFIQPHSRQSPVPYSYQLPIPVTASSGYSYPSQHPPLQFSPGPSGMYASYAGYEYSQVPPPPGTQVYPAYWSEHDRRRSGYDQPPHHVNPESPLAIDSRHSHSNHLSPALTFGQVPPIVEAQGDGRGRQALEIVAFGSISLVDTPNPALGPTDAPVTPGLAVGNGHNLEGSFSGFSIGITPEKSDTARLRSRTRSQKARPRGKGVPGVDGILGFAKADDPSVWSSEWEFGTTTSNEKAAQHSTSIYKGPVPQEDVLPRSSSLLALPAPHLGNPNIHEHSLGQASSHLPTPPYGLSPLMTPNGLEMEAPASSSGAVEDSEIDLDSSRDTFEVKDFGVGFGPLSGTSDAPTKIKQEQMARDKARKEEQEQYRQRKEFERRESERLEGLMDRDRVDMGGYDRDREFVGRLRRDSYGRGGGYNGRRARGGSGSRGYNRGYNRGGFSNPQRQSPYVVTPPHTQFQPLPLPESYSGYYPMPMPPSVTNYLPGGYETYQPAIPIPPIPPPGQGVQPLPAPITVLMYPLDPLRYYLLGQLEYYLSAQNMVQDFFLRQKMDSRGWIPISLIASFPRVKTLTLDVRLVQEVLSFSSISEVKDEWVRMSGKQWEQFVLPTATASTLEGEGLTEAEGELEEEDDDVVFVMGEEEGSWAGARPPT